MYAHGIEHGIEHRCKICNLTEWMNKPIALVLDHVNGKANDSRLENLRLICNNCDAQTDFFKGRNRGSGRKALGLKLSF